MKNMTRQEYVASLRRYVLYEANYLFSNILVFGHTVYMHVYLINYTYLTIGKNILLCLYRKSSGFSRGASIYRGVTRYVFHNATSIYVMHRNKFIKKFPI